MSQTATLPLNIWLYAGCLGVSLMTGGVLLLRAFMAPRSAALRSTDALREPAPPLWRIAWRMVERLAPICRLLAPSMWQVRLAAQLREGGFEMALSPAHFIAGRLLLAIVLLAAGLAVLGPSSLWGLMLFGLLGWFLPAFRLSERVRSRRSRVSRDLPVVLDLIGLGVQSGMTTSLAISLALERGPPGPLRDEFARVMREVKAGRSRQEALRAMGERSAVPGLRHALAAILTAERQGADLSPVLQAQSAQRREERFIDAERRAMQAPVKLLLPLVVFIFPGTFLILMFPIAMQVIADGFFS